MLYSLLVFAAERRAVIVSAVLSVLMGMGCTVLDPNHCGNQDGHATCRMLYAEDSTCDMCVSARNGCIDASIVPKCPVEEVVASTGSTGSVPGSSTSTSTGARDSSTSVDPTAASVSGTGDTSRGPTEGESSSDDTETGSRSTSSSTGAATTYAETEDAVCGDEVITPPEECDGRNLGDATCASALGNPHYRGELACSGTCELATVNCCLGTGATCVVLLNNCCNTCKLLPAGGGLGVCT